jgi:signal transduction histidine kinase
MAHVQKISASVASNEQTAATRSTRDSDAYRPAVLVVDDTPENLLALEAMLRRDDIEIVTASSAAAALDLLLDREVALALLDVHMPGMDGFELAQLMRGVERTRRVPIIFVTAATGDQYRVFAGYELGAVDFLVKPIDPRILQSKIDVFVTLDMQREQLRQAERIRELFLGIVSHDLRNPLTAIRMSAQLAQLYARDENQRRPLHQILSSVDRIGRMIEQLLDMTRIRNAHGVALDPTAADLATIVRSVVAEFPDQAQRCSLDIDGDTSGSWDIDRLSQVISNLIGNAIQHGSSAAPISIRVDGTRDHALDLSVHNAGPAIPGELRDALFEPFHRSSQERTGLGLGLFVCRYFVEAHGGTITVDSSDGEGTCFRVWLPRHVTA